MELDDAQHPTSELLMKWSLYYRQSLLILTVMLDKSQVCTMRNERFSFFSLTSQKYESPSFLGAATRAQCTTSSSTFLAGVTNYNVSLFDAKRIKHPVETCSEFRIFFERSMCSISLTERINANTFRVPSNQPGFALFFIKKEETHTKKREKEKTPLATSYRVRTNAAVWISNACPSFIV